MVILYFYALSYKKAKVSSTVLTSFLLALLALDRNFMGVHFYFQVVLGYSLAAFYIYLWMSETAWRWVDELKTSKLVLSIAEAMCVFGELLVAFIYFFRNPKIEDTWNTNFARNCAGIVINTNQGLFESLSESTGM